MSKKAMKLALEALHLVNLEFVCDGAHHAKKDRHGLGDDCPITARYQFAIKTLEAALEAHKALAQSRSDVKQEQGEAAPVAKNENGSIKWLIDDWPQNCLLYTHPPGSFTYEQVKAHIRAASMSANDIVVGSDVTNDGVSIVIRRRDEVLYAEFFATPQQRKPLTDEQIELLADSLEVWDYDSEKWVLDSHTFARAIEAAHGIKGEA